MEDKEDATALSVLMGLVTAAIIVVIWALTSWGVAMLAVLAVMSGALSFIGLALRLELVEEAQ